MNIGKWHDCAFYVHHHHLCLLSTPSTDYHVVSSAPVPVGGTLSVVSGQKIVLESEDKIKVKVSATAAADVICSILEDV